MKFEKRAHLPFINVTYQKILVNYEFKFDQF